MGFLGYFGSLSSRCFEHREDPGDTALRPKGSADLNIERAVPDVKQHFPTNIGLSESFLPTLDVQEVNRSTSGLKRVWGSWGFGHRIWTKRALARGSQSGSS